MNDFFAAPDDSNSGVSKERKAKTFRRVFPSSNRYSEDSTAANRSSSSHSSPLDAVHKRFTWISDPDESSFLQYGPPKVVLEVWSARQSKPLIRVSLVVVVLTWIISIVNAVIANTVDVLNLTYRTGPGADDVLDVKGLKVSDSTALNWIDIGFRIVVILIAFIILVAFVYRYLKTSIQLRLRAQRFMVVMLCALIFCLIPAEQVVRLTVKSSARIPNASLGLVSVVDSMQNELIVFWSIQDSLFGAIMVCFIWVKSNSLRGPFDRNPYWYSIFFSSILFGFKLACALGLFLRLRKYSAFFSTTLSSCILLGNY